VKGKTVLITGANAGIGRATTLALAGMGAKIVMLCHNRERGQKAMEEIKEESGNPDIDLLVADLSVQANVRRAAAEFAARYSKLHVLINNAGVILPNRVVTGDGLEQTLAVNYLAPFLLTNLLLDRLKAAAPARIINVASGVQMAVDFADLQGEKRYSSLRAYGKSKTALILYTYELARRLAGTGVTANCLHPGDVRTGIFRHYTGLFKLILSISGPLMRSPKKGAQTPVYLASSPKIENVTGRYFVNCRPVKSSASTYDESAARRLWDISAELTKLDSKEEEETHER
jgi:NAD(P)-dependent dehydrogenase (short-subunit alcohol dehydrogenase family)